MGGFLAVRVRRAAQTQSRPLKDFGAFLGNPEPTQRTYSFGLSEDVNAKVDITGPAEVEDLEALKDYVDTLIKSWRRKRTVKVDEGV